MANYDRTKWGFFLNEMNIIEFFNYLAMCVDDDRRARKKQFEDKLNVDR